MTEIKIDDLKTLCLDVLTKTGVSHDHAAITVDHYLENECSGKKSHGMVRVIDAVKAIKTLGLPANPPEIVHDKNNITIIEGHLNMAPVVGQQVVDESVKRAKEYGLSFVGARCYIANTGSMAYYLRQLANKNFIALMSCNSECMVSAPAGIDRLVGTNPIGLAVPSVDGNHFIADFATSAIAKGKVLVAGDKGEDLPDRCIIDKDGNPSTKPSDALQDGSILPLSDYRGFALGLFVELMAVMIGAKALKNDLFGKDGFFIITIDPTHSDAQNYSNEVSAILNQMRNSAPAPGHDHVSIPGDRSSSILKETLQRGTVDVTDKTLEKIKGLAA